LCLLLRGIFYLSQIPKGGKNKFFSRIAFLESHKKGTPGKLSSTQQAAGYQNRIKIPQEIVFEGFLSLSTPHPFLLPSGEREG